MNQSRSTTEHYVRQDEFDPHSVEKLTKDQEKTYFASRRQLMWWKLKRHRLAVVCGFILLLMYGSTIISEWIAPYNLHTRNTEYIYAPPQRVHFFHEGEFIGPFVYGYDYHLNMTNLKREYTPNADKINPIRFFCSGDE